ncbi:MAG: hypothetical protein ACO204_03075 [Schleiferiaceae bacterium]
MKKTFTLWLLVLLFGWAFTACDSKEETGAEAKETAVDSTDEEFDDEDFDDEEFDDEEFDDEEDFEDEEDLEDDEYSEVEPEIVKATPAKPATEIPKKAPAKQVKSEPKKPVTKIAGPKVSTVKSKAGSKTNNVQFQPNHGGLVWKDEEGNGFVVSFLDENLHAAPTKDQQKGGLVHKGKSDWRLPTFDEATYLIDAMPLNSLTAGQREFWTSTPKKGAYYVFNLNKSYRLAGGKDSCGLLLVRELTNED